MLIANALVLTPERQLEDHALRIEDGRIVELAPNAALQPRDGEQVVDAFGLLVAPGLIDLQINGGFGHDFTGDPQTIQAVAAELPRFGVTSFLPTLISCPPDTIEEAQEALETPAHGAEPLGLHLEGPFLNPEKKGAHREASLRPPSLDAVRSWTAENGVRLVTLAPELPGALEVIASLSENGVVVGAGHSLATYARTQDAIRAGLRYGTHLYNAMAPLDHREPGLVGALLEAPEVAVGMIADGIHVHPAMIDLAWRLKGPDRVTLVSDAMAGLGMSPGRYPLAGLDVTVSEHDARLTDGTLAGSVLSADAVLRNLITFTRCSLSAALMAVTSTPAGLMGLEDRSEVTVGKRADLVLLDQGLRVVGTLVEGRWGWRRVGPG